MKMIIVLGISLSSVAGLSQKALNEIDFNRIPQKKIREYIARQQENNVQYFNDIQASCNSDQDLSGYRQLEYTYIIKDNPEKIWENYKYISPAKSWNGKRISFGLLLSKWTDFIMYRNDNSFAGIDTNQVFYVNLKMARGLYNLAVGIKIVDINDTSKTIKYSYLKNGISRGMMTIHIIPTDNNYTKIIHSTAFISDSPFRDKVLYPYFHKRITNEFHRNVKHNFIAEERSVSLEQNNQNVSSIH
ncbi:MAG: hypothetical protein JXJ22_15320 [Bacteroidales bacterium]|nr:hypothetical protein [Bacteroidales bacterium]